MSSKIRKSIKKRFDSKTSFPVYRSLSDKLISVLRKTVDPRADFSTAVKVTHNFSITHSNSTDLHVVIAERMWEEMGSPTLFIEDGRLIHCLYKASYKIDVSKLSMLPLSAVSFPGNIEIDGVRLMPSLFFTMDTSIFKKYVERQIKQSTGKDINYIPDIKYGDFKGESIQLISNAPKLSEPATHMRIWFPKPIVNDVLIDGWAEENLSNEAWTTGEEMHIQRVHLRVLAGLSVYLEAFPDKLVPGLPGIPFTTDAQPRGQASTIKFPYPHDSPEPHLRRWHFRTLRDLCYRRKPDGGLRIVPVNMSFVRGRKDTASTVIRQNGQ